MKVHFYKNESPKEKINKVFEFVETRDCVFLTRTNILNPIIQLRNIPSDCNYIQIAELNRYYFIDNVTNEKNDLYTVYLSVDVLMTYRNQIMGNKTKIVTSEEVINENKTDYVAENKEKTTVFDFPENPFETDKTDILICVRG